MRALDIYAGERKNGSQGMDLAHACRKCGIGGLRRALTAPVDLHVERPLLASSTVITGPRSASSSDSTPSRLLGMICACAALLRLGLPARTVEPQQHISYIPEFDVIYMKETNRNVHRHPAAKYRRRCEAASCFNQSRDNQAKPLCFSELATTQRKKSRSQTVNSHKDPLSLLRLADFR